ncbi:MAG: hypothetical protein WCJ84_02180 [Candidatus Peregrinibacteria bacterium]
MSVFLASQKNQMILPKITALFKRKDLSFGDRVSDQNHNYYITIFINCQ